MIDLLLLEAHSLQGIDHLVLDFCDPVLDFLAGSFACGLSLLDSVQLLAQPTYLLDRLAHPLDVPVLIELSVILVGVPDHLLDPNLLLSQPVAQIQGLLDGDTGIEHHLQHTALAVLHALGDLHLALAGQQRHRAHLAQVHAYRIVGLGVAVLLLLLGGPDHFRLDLFLGGGFAQNRLLGPLWLGRGLHNFNALTAQGQQPVIDRGGRVYLADGFGLFVGLACVVRLLVAIFDHVVRILFRQPPLIRQLEIATEVNHVSRRQVVADPDLWEAAAAARGHAASDRDGSAPDNLRVVPAFRASTATESRGGIGHSIAGVGWVGIVGLFRSPGLDYLCRRRETALAGEEHVFASGLALNRTIGVVPGRTSVGIGLGEVRQGGVPGHGRKRWICTRRGRANGVVRGHHAAHR